ncbi:zinc finger BED domain-containing protein RICESLEEPER 2-like [Eutrema salsugineum]|uniref:zinc finger BED domain-containing protein RICESLEEPER 2-like n=1 Tax=Eutrema salsugineum TaxID=72664 RepID=UPI000CED5C89|nr:zinc finger BED domain-containing protein RICESLEEPER 2-like [Eutrema salsugineum]
MHLRCSAHIINLVVKDGLYEVDKAVTSIRNAVSYVRASTNRVKAFDSRVESRKMTRGSLSLDCKTRWNSTYLMLLRASKFKTTFIKMAEEDKLYTDHFQEKVDGTKRIGPPTPADWESVARLVRFLIIFYKSTLVVSASTFVNSYKCYNEIVTIERNLIKLSTDTDEALRKKATAMRYKFDKYWEGTKKINRLLIVASILDPRNKMKFADMCFDMLYGKDSMEAKGLHDAVIEVMKRLFEEYNSAMVPPVNATSSQSVASSSQTQNHITQESEEQVEGDLDLEEELGYERMDSLYKEMASEIGFQDASNELELYLKERTENPKTTMAGVEYDVLGWWRLNTQKYPVLSEIARDVLAMQVTSVASESAFSTSNRILNPSRSCLTHYMIEVLMCTEQWMKTDSHLNEKEVVITKEQLLAEIEMQDKLQREQGVGVAVDNLEKE